MRHASDERIAQIVQFATQTLNPDALATGPSDSLGLGPDHAADNALVIILQDLGRFPGQGWNLVAAGLRNPVVRVRNFAVRTLRAWPPSQWPAGARQALIDAARSEPAAKTRQAMTDAVDYAGPD